MELETTLHTLAPGLLRFCRGQARDADLAEDAAQEALTALVQRWRRQGPPEVPAAFAFAVARRRLARALRKRRAHTSLEDLLDAPSPGASPEDEAGDRRELAAAFAALGELGARDRECLLLVTAGGLDGKEAAAVLGVSASAFKMRIHRARKRLAAMLGRSETDGGNRR